MSDLDSEVTTALCGCKFLKRKDEKVSMHLFQGQYCVDPFHSV